VRPPRRRSVRLGDDAPGVLLDWDTDFWGVRIGRVAGDTLTPERLRAVDDWATEEGVACMYFLAAAEDARSAQVAEDGGFRLMDLRVELRQELQRSAATRAVREARPEDHERLRAIARASHGATRFYADPNFPDERCDDLYATWIDRSLAGWAAAVLVADRAGAAVGYCSVHLDEGAGIGSIGLIAVEPTGRRSGVGLELTSGAVAWCSSRGARTMSVVTQGRNAAAVRTFQRAGFLVESVELWFHKWYDR
jgi:ribosomal protein S18 acetylase RimI-like enzyme